MPTATRLRVEPGHVQFRDRIQGATARTSPPPSGDVILKRRDQIFAYLLAVVVDDAAQGVTHVVRGADLLDNTPRQIYLQRLLGLPQPGYAHVPVLTEADDSKLAKSRAQRALATRRAAAAAAVGLFAARAWRRPTSLAPAPLREAWDWAIGQWDVNTGRQNVSICA